MIYRVTKKIKWCSGHRIYGHTGDCRFLHGHNYEAHITAEMPKLDRLGMVCDFKEFGLIKKWVDDNWDHAFLISAYDDMMLRVKEMVGNKSKWFVFPKSDLYDWNTTAECMAKFLLDDVCCGFMQGQTKIKKIRVYETDTCYAEVEHE